MDLDVKGTTSQQKLNSNMLAQVCVRACVRAYRPFFCRAVAVAVAVWL